MKRWSITNESKLKTSKSKHNQLFITNITIKKYKFIFMRLGNTNNNVSLHLIVFIQMDIIAIIILFVDFNH